MKKVLIVEDEDALREAFTMIFDIKGFKTAEAANGQIALSVLKEFEPDIIILDIMMPIMSGFEFLEKANLAENYPKTKVLVLSNLSDEKSVNKAKELGSDEFILKSSVSPATLVETINNILSSR